MANSSNPRTNSKTKMPATSKERASLQIQRRHMPLPPGPFPASYQSMISAKIKLQDHRFE